MLHIIQVFKKSKNKSLFIIQVMYAKMMHMGLVDGMWLNFLTETPVNYHEQEDLESLSKCFAAAAVVVEFVDEDNFFVVGSTVVVEFVVIGTHHKLLPAFFFLFGGGNKKTRKEL